MANNKRDKQSFVPPVTPIITAWASIAGKKESQGPLGKYFDITSTDTFFGEKTWEQAEKHMQELALQKLAEKAGIQPANFEAVFS